MNEQQLTEMTLSLVSWAWGIALGYFLFRERKRLDAEISLLKWILNEEPCDKHTAPKEGMSGANSC